MSRAKKIFVEQDEDIIFTVEKVLNSEENRVIVVVPQNAALTSSAVSLKILSRQISKSEKNIVLVTDSEVGSRLGEKADIAIVDKVSSVTSDVWANAKSLKEKMIHELSKLSEYFSEQATQLLKDCNVELTMDELLNEISIFKEAFNQY